MNFEIQLSSRTNKFLRTVNKRAHAQIIKKVGELAKDPFPQNAKKVLGQEEKTLRVRIGDYRILYVVFLDKKILLVVDISRETKV